MVSLQHYLGVVFLSDILEKKKGPDPGDVLSGLPRYGGYGGFHKWGYKLDGDNRENPSTNG